MVERYIFGVRKMFANNIFVVISTGSSQVTDIGIEIASRLDVEVTHPKFSGGL